MKIHLSGLFDTLESEKAEPEKELSALFGTPSVNGDTPPEIPSRIIVAYDETSSTLKGSQGSWIDVPESVQKVLTYIVQNQKNPKWRFRRVRRQGRVVFSISTKSQRVFARIYDSDEGNRTVALGAISYHQHKELVAAWQVGK